MPAVDYTAVDSHSTKGVDEQSVCSWQLLMTLANVLDHVPDTLWLGGWQNCFDAVVIRSHPRLIPTYRDRESPLGAGSNVLFSSALGAKRVAKRQQRESEAAALSQRRENKKRDARARVLAKRRRALRSCVQLAPMFFKSHDVITRAWRTALAKKFLMRARSRTSLHACSAHARVRSRPRPSSVEYTASPPPPPHPNYTTPTQPNPT